MFAKLPVVKLYYATIVGGGHLLDIWGAKEVPSFVAKFVGRRLNNFTHPKEIIKQNVSMIFAHTVEI